MNSSQDTDGGTGYFRYMQLEDGSGMNFVDVDIAGRASRVIPSTATSHNIANKSLLNQLGLTEQDLQPTSKVFRCRMTGSPMTSIGRIDDVPLTFRGVTIRTSFYVIEGFPEYMLSFATIMKLNMLEALLSA